MDCLLINTPWKCKACEEHPHLEGKCLTWCSAELQRCKQGNEKLNLQLLQAQAQAQRMAEAVTEILEECDKQDKRFPAACYVLPSKFIEMIKQATLAKEGKEKPT